MKPRTARLHPVLRAFAAGCAALWIGGVVLCDAEHLFEAADARAGGDDRPTVHRAAGLAHDDNAGDHTGAGKHSHDHHSDHAEHNGHQHSDHQHNHGDGEACCSTIKATSQPSTPVVVYPPTGHIFVVPPEVLAMRASALIALERRIEHPPPDRDWIFTPEVYLGPAVRSHAPPASA